MRNKIIKPRLIFVIFNSLIVCWTFFTPHNWSYTLVSKSCCTRRKFSGSYKIHNEFPQERLASLETHSILFHDVILTLQRCKDTRRNSAGCLPGVRIEKFAIALHANARLLRASYVIVAERLFLTRYRLVNNPNY